MMPAYLVTTPEGKRFKVTAPSIEAAQAALESQEGERAIGYGRALAQGALIDTPEGLGGLVDLMNPFSIGMRMAAEKGAAPTLSGLVTGERPQIPRLPTYAEKGKAFGESLIGPRQTGTEGEERASRAVRGALVSAPFAVGAGPLGFAASLAGGAMGDVAQGEAEKAGLGTVPSVGVGAAVDIAASLAGRNIPRAVRSLSALTAGAKPVAQEVAEAVAESAAKESVESAPEVAGLALRSEGEALEFAGRAFSTEPVADYAGRLRVGRFDSLADDLSADAIRKTLRDTTEQFASEIDVARRGVRSHAVTEEAAMRLGMDPNELLARRSGQAFNAEELRAADAVMAKTAGALTEARDAVLREATEENLARLQAALTGHAAVQAQVMGATAEAGRALNILKKTTKYRKQGEMVEAIVRSAGGREKLLQIAEGLKHLDTPGAVNAFVREAMPATTGEKVVEAWKAALLSNPATHIVNATSNAAFQAWNLAEEGLTALGESARTASRGPMREFASRLYGTRQGMAQGFRLMKAALASEMPAEFSKAAESAARPGAIGGQLGRFVRLPFRALGASDAFFRTVAEQQEIAAQAMRKAYGAGLRGQELAAEVKRLTLNPTEEMLEAATKHGQRIVFQRELGESGRAAQRLLRSHPGAQAIVPFFKTPVNIAKEAIHRMPTAAFSKDVRKALATGGRARTEALARVGLGSAFGAWVVGESIDGNITGFGPEDPAERAVWFENHQPYSFKIGDRWVSYQRVEPLATIIGTAADLAQLYQNADADKEGLDEIAGRLSMIMAHNLTSKTFLRGVVDFGNAVMNPSREGERWAQSLAGSVVPSGVAQVARTDDPVLRETRSIVDAVINRVPGLRSSLPAKISAVTGEEIALGGAVGPDVASPFYAKEAGNNHVAAELTRLRAGVSRPERGDFTDAEYDRLQREAGKLGHERAERVLRGAYYARLPDDEKVKRLTDAYRDARSIVRNKIRYARKRGSR
jgi:hypothetical protein